MTEPIGTAEYQSEDCDGGAHRGHKPYLLAALSILTALPILLLVLSKRVSKVGANKLDDPVRALVLQRHE